MLSLNQDEDYLDTIEIAGLLPATYQDADGNLIRVFKNGKIKYDGKRYPSFKKFQQSQTDNFLITWLFRKTIPKATPTIPTFFLNKSWR